MQWRSSGVVMYKVVVHTWYEPGWECFDGCCWEPSERRWIIAESNIPWNYLLDKEYDRYWLTEEEVYFAILEYKVDASTLYDLRCMEDPLSELRQLLVENDVEVVIIDEDED